MTWSKKWSEVDESSRELDALVELGRSQSPTYTRADLDAGFATLSARLEARGRRKRLQHHLLPFAAVVLGGLVLGSLVFVGTRAWRDAQPVPLTYVVHGGALLDGGYLRESGNSGVTVAFAEGTKCALAPGARAKLRSVDARGARLVLESGTASWDVTPDVRRRWEVEVGPFLVQVKGTTFDLAWDPRVEQFQLNLERGHVLVSGPVSGGELNLLAGQRLSVDLRRGETKITEARAPLDATHDPNPKPNDSTSLGNDGAGATAAPGREPAQDSASATQAAVATSHEPATPIAVSRDAETTKPPRQWSNELARGQWDAILRDAEANGISTTLNTASAEDLFTLANAARYRQRAVLARDTLLALRRRFGQSSRSLDATFLLGRVEESRGDTKAAEKWYDEYLARAPSGTYVAEAMGRKMTLVSRSLGTARARPLAERYLQRFPNGSYAGAARALLAAP